MSLENSTHTDTETESHPLIGDELVDILKNDIPHEEPLLTDLNSRGSDGQEKIDFADKWFPEKENYDGKTIITPEQARAIVQLRHVSNFFDEFSDMQPMINSMIDDYEILLTSIEGQSRNEQRSILEAIFGRASEAEEGAKNFMAAFAPGDEDNDD